MNYREHEEPLLGSKMDLGITDVESGVLRFPQAIAHRGFKAQFPENTLTAFEGAVKAGAHAIETDLHLSKDGVVMISHDATLKRCFGAEGKLIDYDYSYLKTLRTLEAPHVPMPTLKEVLEFMCQPAVLDMWLLLDIKIDNDAEEIIRQTASAIHSVNPSREFWANRIVLGCWTLNFLPLCDYYLPGFPIAGVSQTSRCFVQSFLCDPFWQEGSKVLE
ncbi:PLC-like phosphodiesterase [Choiromyces venosus 120613-1]|uniref:PLC-like phosphodiesterase n=1 Tax=Choiromyces venosus 120613-1 TaxID=1336337 RepID=A0A3N4IZU2_9PEZI|nr:PLC-like phosphodiesterase [Choiromyces venosus 120613-1]